MVEVTGLEPAASWSQTKRPTSWATPRIFNCPYIIHERKNIVNEFQTFISYLYVLLQAELNQIYTVYTAIAENNYSFRALITIERGKCLALKSA